MPLLLMIRVFFVTTAFMLALIFVANVHAEMDPRFVLDSQTMARMKGAAKPRQRAKKRISKTHDKQSVSISDKDVFYTVKPGDNLFKILMRDYNFSNKEAESLIEIIKRENNIYDIKRLKIGKKILIPLVPSSSNRSTKLLQDVRTGYRNNSGTKMEQSFKLNTPVTTLSEQETITRAHDMWNRIVPSTIEQMKPLTINSAVFSLTLDPERYPMFAGMNGGRIVLDQNGSIPPLVKSLIEDKDTSVRIVTEAPSGTKRFMSSLLEAGGFYSVEENFSMEFGVDPKLTVRADFKVEKTAESIIKQDVVLVNSGRTSFSPAIGEFLKKEGFSLYEPFASLKPFEAHDSRPICHISAKNQPEIIDSILSAFSISPERDRRVDVFAADNNGISLSVKGRTIF